jgi:hypothetical protein
MDRKRRRRFFAFAVCWAAALVGFLAFGERRAYVAPPPPCIMCDCKNVTFWQPPLGQPVGAYDTGATDPRANWTTYGVTNINTSGGCDGQNPTQNGTFDLHLIAGSSVVCSPLANASFGVELSVTVGTVGWPPGSLLRSGAPRLQCPAP